jgi:hypothetical protein
MGGVIPAGAGTGNTLYGNILSADDAKIANGSALVTYSQSNWTDYVNSMPEQAGSGRYILTVPGYLPNGRYFVIPYLQLGGSPAAGDTPLDIIFFDWRDGNVLGFGSSLNVGQINGSAPAAVNLSLNALASVNGQATAGTLTTSQMTTNLASTIVNVYAGRVIYFTSGGNAGRAALITAYSVTGAKLTFLGYNNLPITVAPSVGDTFIII